MKKTNRKNTEVSYWESMADSMVGLLLCIMLIMLLLMLYLIRIEDNKMLDEYFGFSYEKYDDPDKGGGNHSYGKVDNDAGNSYADGWDSSGGNYGGGGGYGGGSYADADEYREFEDPDPGAGEGEGSDRAAVLVQVIDGETERTVKKEGITFELYNRDALLQTLHTYYPKKVAYKQYKTDSSGVFFLPERLRVENYHLHCLTAIAGYDTGEDTYFEIDQSYDWEDPYVLNVKLFPSKNVIEVRCKDMADGKPLPGASFQVVAAENVTTADGTLRYREGSVVDNITIGSDGVGRSKDLYLGSYLLRQSTVPEYYGKAEKDQPVTLKARTTAKRQETADVFAEKTSVTLTLVDELFETKPLANALFTLRDGNDKIVQTVTTNEQGRFSVSNLKKNTNYRICQENVPAGYLKTEEDLTFRVTGDGYISGSPNADLKLTNRTLRLGISVQDQLFRGLVSDVNLALMDSSGSIVKNWTSTGMEQVIEGLPAGDYKLIISGNQAKAAPIRVENVPDLQQIRVDRWTTVDIVALVAAAVVAAGLIALLVKYRRKKKQQEERV